MTTKLPTNRPPTHSGEMLLEEFLTPYGLSQSAPARRLGISFPRFHEILERKRGVTPDIALRLEGLFRWNADTWLALQQDWDLWHAKREAHRPEKIEPLTRASS